MINKPRKRIPKAAGLNQPPPGVTKKNVKKLPKRSQRRSWLWSTLAVSLLLSSAGVIIGVGWMSVLFILNPTQISWVNDFLPKWAKISTGKRELPQTFTAIELGLTQQQRLFGEIMSLDGKSEESFLLPIFQKRKNCQSHCQELVELRIYKLSQDWEYKFQSEKYYYLITKLPVIGLSKSLIESSSVAAISESDNQETKIRLPLTKMKAFADSHLVSGFWFYLRGEHKNNDNNITYGQIIYYNPTLKSLQKMLSWKTRNGQLPKWQQITGNDAKELIIDQTVNVEPNLQVYQVKPSQLVANSIYLEAINFQKPAVNEFAFQQSLFLARNGLWTPAFTWLKSLEKQRKQPFSAAARAQIDVIRLHSEFTRMQAEKSWASPHQQVTADIIDGRWEKALQVLEKSPDNGQEITNLLQTDQGRIWNRAAVALRLNPNRRAVLAWVALIFKVQRGEERANAWLQAQRNINGETLNYIQGILTQLDDDKINAHKSRIIGTVKQVSRINEEDWLPISLQTDLKITNNQVWYQVEVSAFHDGTSWLSDPFANFDQLQSQPRKFWRKLLGISSDPSMQVIVWKPNGEQEVTRTTIKAVQVRGQGLRLLMLGSALPESKVNSFQPRPLALTMDALTWVEPSPVTVKDLYQQQPQLVESMLPVLWRKLQQSGDLTAGVIPDVQEMREKMADWPVQLADLTNDQQQEIVVTISDAAIASLNQFDGNTSKPADSQKRPRTLIFSAGSNIIYSDFASANQQTLIAIAQLTDDQSLALLVENRQGYSLERWSQTNQRFE
ncbi:hypothetical protein IQ226_10945 [Dolichospermum sp. LEGE 00240]|uniref:hypothetical protein n=1 Tax=Dolichospermum sp. LEGE 00240 TaxID=1828603 RepID=UPI001880E62F|nr:hypothetical protein [Dolichospermum sp. LEGE 00240]MBE9249670.1 hypothetical protein [Dolichospermum sp. LEGE 00240]